MKKLNSQDILRIAGGEIFKFTAGYVSDDSSWTMGKYTLHSNCIKDSSGDILWLFKPNTKNTITLNNDLDLDAYTSDASKNYTYYEIFSI
jgi:hypothetical protein